MCEEQAMTSTVLIAKNAGAFDEAPELQSEADRNLGHADIVRQKQNAPKLTTRIGAELLQYEC
jgi:hypothetical protein